MVSHDEDLHVPQASAEDLHPFSDNSDGDITGDLDIDVQELDLQGDNTEPPIMEDPVNTQQHSEEATHSHWTTVEDVPDDDDTPSEDNWYIFSYPAELCTEAPIGQGVTDFEKIQVTLERNGMEWGLFADENEWQLAEWLLKNVEQMQADAFLKLPIVSVCIFFFHDTYTVKDSRTNQTIIYKSPYLYQKIWQVTNADCCMEMWHCVSQGR